MQLEGKVALVTGASRGIGKQIALALAQAGADVVVAARTVEARKRLPGTIGETTAAIEDCGRRALAVATDVTNPDDLERLVLTTMAEFGRIDVLVNNAAYTAGKSWGSPLDEIVFDDWLMQWATNVHAPFLLTRAAVPIMRAQGGGVIVNMTSKAGDLQEPDIEAGVETRVSGSPPLAYASTKAAINRLVNVLAPALRSDKIAVVALDPGFVRTEMVDLMVAGGFDASASIPMSVPAKAVVRIATSPDPMQYTGRVLRAEHFA